MTLTAKQAAAFLSEAYINNKAFTGLEGEALLMAIKVLEDQSVISKANPQHPMYDTSRAGGPQKNVFGYGLNEQMYTAVVSLSLEDWRTFVDLYTRPEDDVSFSGKIAQQVRRQLPRRTEKIPYDKITKALLGRTRVGRKSPINSVTFQTNSISIHTEDEWGSDLIVPVDVLEVYV